MANLVQINSFQNKFSENLLPNTALFNSETIVNFTGTGSSNYSLENFFSYSRKGKAIQIQALRQAGSGNEVSFDFDDALSYTATHDGTYLFQFGMLLESFFSPNSSLECTIEVEVYINAVLSETYTRNFNPFSLELQQYYHFAQNFFLFENDEINYKFRFSYPDVAPNPVFEICFDAFQLNHDKINIGFGLPTPYTLPEVKDRIRAIGAPTTLINSDEIINITGGSFTQPIITAIGNQGLKYDFINNGTGIITLDANGTELIDGLGTFTLPVKQSVSIKSDGAGWIITDIGRRETLNRTQWIQTISPTTVNNAASLNLLTLISNANKSVNGTDGGFYELATATDKILTKWGGVVQTHHIRIGFTITTGTDQHYNLTLRRYSDNSILSSAKINRDADTGVCTADFLTYTYSASDPFVTGGFYIQLDNNSGASVELTTSVNLLIVTYFK